MSAAELDIIINGAEVLALIGAVWSVLFFGKVRLSSPPVPKAAAAPKADETAKPVIEPVRRAS